MAGSWLPRLTVLVDGVEQPTRTNLALVSGTGVELDVTDSENDDETRIVVSATQVGSVVRLAATGNLNLDSEALLSPIVDGETVATGYRILLPLQTDPTENGEYVATVSDGVMTLARAPGMAAGASVTPGLTVAVQAGDGYGGLTYSLRGDGSLIVGTDALEFALANDVVPAYPAGGESDDWPALIARVTAHAYRRPVQMMPVTRAGLPADWRCASKVALPSGAHIIGGPDVVVQCDLTYGGVDVFNAPFQSNVAASGANTTLASAATRGAVTVSSNASYSAGSYISIETGSLRRQYYEVQSVSGAGPYTLTLDRPLCEAWPSGANVYGWTSIPRDIRIEGRGMLVTGTADRYFEFGGTWDSVVSDVHMDPSGGALGVGSLAASWDIGCLRCRWEDCTVDSAGAAINGGMTIESGESCHIIRCTAKNLGTGGAAAAHAVYDSWFCTIQDCNGSGSYYGAAHTGNAGGVDCEIRGGSYFGNTVGVIVGNGQRSRLIGVAAVGNTTGFKINTEDDPKMEACSAAENTTDLDVAVTNLVMPPTNQWVSLTQASSAIIIDTTDDLAALLQLSPVFLAYADQRYMTRVATKCSLLQDRGSAGFELTEATAGNRPVFTPRNAAYGNRGTLDFTAASSQRLANAGSLALAQPFWWLVVGHNVVDTSGFVESATTSIYAGTTTSNEYLSLYAGSAKIGTAGSVTSPKVLVAEFNGASSKGWVGQYTTPQFTGQNPGSNGITTLRLGGGIVTNYMTGSIALVAGFSGASTTAQRKLAMRLAAAAYKLPVAVT